MSAENKGAAIMAAALLGYAIALPLVGFFASSAVFLVASMTLFGVSPLTVAIPTSVGLLATLFILFEYLLGVPLPHGALY